MDVASKPGTKQHAYNEARLQFCVNEEWSYVIKHCETCKSTGLLVGISQTDSQYCQSCLEMNSIRDTKKKEEMTKAWEAVRPCTTEYMKRVERGHEGEDLPPLSVGERSAIAVTLPFVTVTKVLTICKQRLYLIT